VTTLAEALRRAAYELREAADDDARLEAEVLLAHVLGIDRSAVLARMSDQLSSDDASAFDTSVDRRAAREPLAYIVGHREFYGLDFACAPAVLIPRPETEMLVDVALEEIARRGDAIRIVDVGTGSGAIAIAITLHAAYVRMTAVDASADALDVARANARVHDVDRRITFRQADLLEGTGIADVIVANLPYVAATEWDSLQPEIRLHEPRAALIAGAGGIEVIKRFIEQAPRHLALGGVIAAEIGETQADRLLAVAHRTFPDASACVMKDFAGRDRVLVIRREGDAVG
jgi:release factor glutamine methyltransferase